MSIAVMIVHITEGPHNWGSKLMLVIVILLALRRTFQFLRIFKPLTTIVVMVQQVIVDLRVFMTFYVILLLFFSIITNCLGAYNYRLEGTSF